MKRDLLCFAFNVTTYALWFAEKSDNTRTRAGGSKEHTALTPEDRRAILDHLAAEVRRRRRIPLNSLTISADGKECIRLDTNTRSGRFKVDDGAKLIEIWTEDQGSKILLATHWIEYTNSQGIAPSTATVDLGVGTELLLKTIPQTNMRDEPGSAQIFVKWRPVSRWVRWRQFFTNRPR